MDINIIISIIALLALGAILGYFIKDVEEDDIKDYYEDYYEQKTEENLDLYVMGINDKIIREISSFVLDCRPTNPEVFVWASLDKVKRGIIIKCGNVTHGLRYSDEYFRRLE